MTILVGCVCALLTACFASGIALVGTASVRDARAQIAADAAVLAAIVESAPGGSGRPEVHARRFAELNGARLLECVCVVGSDAMQVRVALDGAIARARAVFDAALLSPAGSAVDTAGLHPALRLAVERLLEAADGAVHVVSGYRASDEQARLWAAALRRYGSRASADDWVAPPGTSMHERGLAVDLGGDLVTAENVIRRLGLPMHDPLPNEPWHFELRR